MRVKRILGGCVVALVCVALLSSCALLPPSTAVGLGVANSNQQADAEMQHIEDAVKAHDAAALKTLFSKTARAKGADLDGGIKDFLSFFQSGFKNLGEPDGGPGEFDADDFGKRTVELLGDYEVRMKGKLYDLYFADFTVNQIEDPNNVGLYALGVAPYNAHGFTHPTAASTAFNAWTSQYLTKSGKLGPPSVYVYGQQK